MLVAIINKTLISPAPTLSSNAPANGASKIKNIIDKITLPMPIAEIITIKFFEKRTKNDVNTKQIVKSYSSTASNING